MRRCRPQGTASSARGGEVKNGTEPGGRLGFMATTGFSKHDKAKENGDIMGICMDIMGYSGICSGL